jgi:hypothetical protein
MLHSLKVVAAAIEPANRRPTFSAKRAKISGLSTISKPPREANQRGTVQWLSVTIGANP